MSPACRRESAVPPVTNTDATTGAMTPTPTTSSDRYMQSITRSESEAIKTIAMAKEYSQSAIASATDVSAI